MNIEVSFPEGKRVDATLGGFTVHTDQPAREGGGDTAPAPFDLFLASLATCTGFFVMSFLDRRGLPRDDVRLELKTNWDAAEHRATRIQIEITVPPSFPEGYKRALTAVVNQCTVKKHLENPPVFQTIVRSYSLAGT